jgi:hypothetical protein
MVMRLWSLHPKYLDPPGLVALWREALLAQKVLQGNVKGYRSHPQLLRFRSHPHPLAAIASYLQNVHDESKQRGYWFDADKIGRNRTTVPIDCTHGQLLHEWEHLLKKLRVRSPGIYKEFRYLAEPEPHPLFRLIKGEPEPWEKSTQKGITGKQRKNSGSTHKKP